MIRTGHSAAHQSIRRHQWASLAVVLLLVGGAGSWAATMDIAGAVIAPGMLVVDNHTKKVQHPTGGVVAEIHARDGASVNAGDVLIRLDDTIMRASLAIVSKSLIEQRARKARLEAERDGATRLEFPRDLKSDFGEVESVMAGERRLFELRRDSRLSQKARLRQRVEQLKHEIDGLTIQSTAKAREIGLIQTELDGARGLYKKNLMPITKMTNLEREATRVTGESGKLKTEIARAQARVAETLLQIIQIDKDLASEVANALRETEAEIGQLVERMVAAKDQLSRVELRAPQSGIVHRSTVHTIGGVIDGGETIMLIVPKTESLTVEAKVAPQDIDQVYIGQEAMLRFSAFNQRSTPEITGHVQHISADITTDETTGSSHYTIRLTMPADELARLGNVALIPGMPVEVFVKTGDRKVLSYLVKPLSDQIMRAFREQ